MHPKSRWFNRLSIALALLPLALSLTSCVQYRLVQLSTQYLAYNIWFLDPDIIQGGGLKHQPYVLPIGTPVNNIKVHELDEGPYTESSERIQFSLAYNPEKVFTMWLEPKYYRNIDGTESLESVIERTFTDEPLEAQLKGFTDEEREFIRKGLVTPGMSKKAILKSWGYPPKKATRELDDPRWYYWLTRLKTAQLDFDKNDILTITTDYGKEIGKSSTVIDW